MALHDVSLADRFDLSQRTVLLGGIQALVRALLMQKARDEAAGLVTAGYATGYRGSPLGGVDQAMWKAQKQLEAADIKFEPGLNEDLAATALWGSQQAEPPRRGPRRRASSASGTARAPASTAAATSSATPTWPAPSSYGGVVACLGDDHTGESSTACTTPSSRSPTR